MTIMRKRCEGSYFLTNFFPLEHYGSSALSDDAPFFFIAGQKKKN
jgi:hypothetical protein